MPGRWLESQLPPGRSGALQLQPAAGIVSHALRVALPGETLKERDSLPALEPLADGTGYRCKIRFGTGRQRRFRITTPNEAAAIRRRDELVEIGAAIGKAQAAIDPVLGASLLTMAGEGDAERVRKTVAKLAAGLKAQKRGTPQPGVIVTIADLGKAWTDGELAEHFPDHVKLKKTASKDAERLERLDKAIGHVCVAAFSLADAERAMAALPKGLASATRRQYAQILGRMMGLAVYPLKLISASPLPRGFLPKVKRTKATAWLYPSEDAQLMASPDVPLARRVLYGFLAREGCRASEALALRWSDLDLARGVLKLDRNKTEEGRVWTLTPGVAAALKRFKPAGAEPADLVFNVLNAGRLADAFRADLEAAKIDRAELFERSKTRQPIRLHDLRATFVTLALAAGKSETWVSDRTGHRSSVMIQNYRRAARTAAELNLGGLARLNTTLVWSENPRISPTVFSATNPPPRKRSA